MVKLPLLRRHRRGQTPAETYSALYPRPRLGVDRVPRACPTKPTTRKEPRP